MLDLKNILDTPKQNLNFNSDSDNPIFNLGLIGSSLRNTFSPQQKTSDDPLQEKIYEEDVEIDNKLNILTGVASNILELIKKSIEQNDELLDETEKINEINAEKYKEKEKGISPLTASIGATAIGGAGGKGGEGGAGSTVISWIDRYFEGRLALFGIGKLVGWMENWWKGKGLPVPETSKPPVPEKSTPETKPSTGDEAAPVNPDGTPSGEPATPVSPDAPTTPLPKTGEPLKLPEPTTPEITPEAATGGIPIIGPLIVGGIVAYQKYKELQNRKDLTELQKIEAEAVSGGSTAIGAAVGELAGTFTAPGPGTIIGGVGGSIAGAKIGEHFSEKITGPNPEPTSDASYSSTSPLPTNPFEMPSSIHPPNIPSSTAVKLHDKNEPIPKNIEDFMKREEDVKLNVYPDAGSSAIGIGHDLSTKELDTGIINVNGKEIHFKPWSGNPDKNGITNEEAEEIYHNDYKINESEVINELTEKNWEKLPIPIKETLIDYHFNTGHLPTGFEEAIEKNDIAGAKETFITGVKKSGAEYTGVAKQRHERNYEYASRPEEAPATSVAGASPSIEPPAPATSVAGASPSIEPPATPERVSGAPPGLLEHHPEHEDWTTPKKSSIESASTNVAERIPAGTTANVAEKIPSSIEPLPVIIAGISPSIKPINIAEKITPSIEPAPTNITGITPFIKPTANVAERIPAETAANVAEKITPSIEPTPSFGAFPSLLDHHPEHEDWTTPEEPAARIAPAAYIMPEITKGKDITKKAGEMESKTYKGNNTPAAPVIIPVTTPSRNTGKMGVSNPVGLSSTPPINSIDIIHKGTWV
jgi:GH24 family phage-related lysozyme (muramidase)